MQVLTKLCSDKMHRFDSLRKNNDTVIVISIPTVLRAAQKLEEFCVTRERSGINLQQSIAEFSQLCYVGKSIFTVFFDKLTQTFIKTLDAGSRTGKQRFFKARFE